MLNYYCTWNAQNCVRPDAIDEPSAEVFIGAAGARKARDYLCEESLLGAGGLADQYEAVRGQLYFLLDDGWDVPYGIHPDQNIHGFGSLELAEDRFPSFRGTPAQRLAGVNRALQSMGWKGAGIWVAAQSRGESHERGFIDDAASRRYWSERILWSLEAGVEYWKVDWGCRQFEPAWRAMLDELRSELYPGLHIEHCHPAAAPVNNVVLENGRQMSDGRFSSWEPWRERWADIMENSEIFRSYDVLWQFSQASTLDRISTLMQDRPDAETIINCEDEAYIGAVLGCSMGVMRSGKYRPIPVFDFDPQLNSRKLTEVIRAIRWQERYPAMPVRQARLKCGAETIRESYCFRPGETWMKEYEHQQIFQECASVIVRGMELPDIRCEALERPLIIASRNGDAVAAASLPRSMGGKWQSVPAEIHLPAARRAGIFGNWSRVGLELPSEGFGRVLARDLADDGWTDITEQVNAADGTIQIEGQLIDRLCRCGDRSEPGAEILLEGNA